MRHGTSRDLSRHSCFFLVGLFSRCLPSCLGSFSSFLFLPMYACVRWKEEGRDAVPLRSCVLLSLVFLSRFCVVCSCVFFLIFFGRKIPVCWLTSTRTCCQVCGVHLRGTVLVTRRRESITGNYRPGTHDPLQSLVYLCRL